MYITLEGTQMCQITIADTFFSRLIGLMFKKNIEKKTGLLIRRCSSIHTFFMRFPIDVIYLDKNDVILDKETVKPWRLGKFVKHARHVLELPQGEKDNYTLGSKLEINGIRNVSICKNKEEANERKQNIFRHI